MNESLHPAPSASLLPHIMVVDDDDRLRDLLRRYLVEQGCIVLTAAGAAPARDLLQHMDIDLIVLDVMMPEETGLQFLQGLRQTHQKNIPVLLLTAKGEASDRIAGFEGGADDYLTKPFEPKELLLRVQSILRRTALTSTKPLAIKLGRWQFDPARDELTAGDDVQKLTEMEAHLLRLLLAEPGRALSRENLAEKSRGMISDRTIDVQVTRLRRKIEDDAKNPRVLVTVRGEGYRVIPS
jgi:two-component system, OmpR family, phosphate regulon response regulator OmpR